MNAPDLLKAFVVALKNHILERKEKYSYTSTEGGCDTCGYGGTEYTGVYSAFVHGLDEDIDEFSASFIKDNV